MEQLNNLKKETGAVTFLDVLGWKGIWQQNPKAIETLYSLVQQVKRIAENVAGEYQNVKELRGKSEITTVLSISDTIAMFTAAPAEVAIEIQAKICSKVLPEALLQELPLRGAVSYGDYTIKDRIMLGYAVDEAASWHEATDWIGVVLSPSASLKIRGKQPETVIEYDKIPFKNPEKNLKYCIDWSFPKRDELLTIIDKKGPLIPEIAPKYLNTLAFLDMLEEKKETEEQNAR